MIIISFQTRLIILYFKSWRLLLATEKTNNVPLLLRGNYVETKTFSVINS